jgi:prolipoprotein diacylglyceryltransferase
MHIHLIFDLLSYFIGGIVSIIFVKFIFKNKKNALTTNQKYSYYFVLLIGFVIGSFLFGSLNINLSNLEQGHHGFILGKSVLGALFGGIFTITIFKYFTKMKKSTGIIFVPALALGIFIGRWGCFFTGISDFTYGIETDFFLGHNFGDGVFRHPTQLYEGFSMLLFFIIFTVFVIRKNIFWLKNGFYLFTIFYGFQRFIWEFLKPYETLIWHFNLFHFLCFILIIYGVIMIIKKNKQKTLNEIFNSSVSPRV